MQEDCQLRCMNCSANWTNWQFSSLQFSSFISRCIHVCLFIRNTYTPDSGLTDIYSTLVHARVRP